MFNVYTGDTLSRSRCYGNVVLDPTGTGSSFSLRLLVLLHRAPLPVSVDVVIVERWNGHGREREEGGRGGARLATDREMRITYILGDPVRCNRLFCYLVNERIRAGLLVCWFFAATRESDSCNLYGRNFQRCFGK